MLFVFLCLAYFTQVLFLCEFLKYLSSLSCCCSQLPSFHDTKKLCCLISALPSLRYPVYRLLQNLLIHPSTTSPIKSSLMQLLSFIIMHIPLLLLCTLLYSKFQFNILLDAFVCFILLLYYKFHKIISHTVQT